MHGEIIGISGKPASAAGAAACQNKQISFSEFLITRKCFCNIISYFLKALFDVQNLSLVRSFVGKRWTIFTTNIIPL